MTKAPQKHRTVPPTGDRALPRRSASERVETDVPIPLQFGEQIFWATLVRDLRGRAGAAPSHDLSLPRAVAGRLRVGDLDYALFAPRKEPDPSIGHRDALEVLSERETQIALLVSRGKVTKQIACNLKISEHTVRAYMRRIFGKLHVSNRPAMVAKVLKCIGSDTTPMLQGYPGAENILSRECCGPRRARE